MFEFWREAMAVLVPGLLCQSGRRRPENVSILSSLLTEARLEFTLHGKLDLHKFTRGKYGAKKVQTRGKLKAKKVNAAFACQFTWGCKF